MNNFVWFGRVTVVCISHNEETEFRMQWTAVIHLNSAFLLVVESFWHQSNPTILFVYISTFTTIHIVHHSECIMRLLFRTSNSVLCITNDINITYTATYYYYHYGCVICCFAVSLVILQFSLLCSLNEGWAFGMRCVYRFVDSSYFAPIWSSCIPLFDVRCFGKHFWFSANETKSGIFNQNQFKSNHNKYFQMMRITYVHTRSITSMGQTVDFNLKFIRIWC